MKKRIDVLLVERGLAVSRGRAQSLIMANQVLVDDTPVIKAGDLVAEDSVIRLRGEDIPFVSRGGLKLAAAIDSFQVSVKGRVALDIGASTGGFTDVLLQAGASRVFAVDVGHSQLDWKIRKDPRVIVHEKVNARTMEYSLIGETVDLIVMDVSFISIEKILPNLLNFSKPGETDWITLIKPQFEVGKEKVGKGGIVTSDQDRRDAITKVKGAAESLGLRFLDLIESPITGTQGNIEFLAHWKQKP